MEYLVVSFTHKNTDLSIREKLAFNNELEKSDTIKKLLEVDFINEVVIISTCNRVEIIVSCSIVNKTISKILQLLSVRSDILTNKLEEIADIYENESAIYHIFMVASSLDSLVVGETQIVGQLKQAYFFSKNNNFCSFKLDRVFEASFKCAKIVRNKTKIGSGSTSVASAAVSGAKKHFPHGANAVVVGAGEMSELATRHLLRNNFKVIICSRNYKKAKLLSQMIKDDKNGVDFLDEDLQVKEYKYLNELLNSCEVLISATSAPYPIIKKDMIKRQDFKRVWFDIAIPRDIEDVDISDLQIYRVDDLKEVVDENLSLRAQKAKLAISIVKEEVDKFFDTIKISTIEPFLKQIHTLNYKKASKKLNNAIKKGYINKNDKNNVEKLLQNMVNEIFFKMSRKFKKEKVSKEYITFLNQLFGEEDEI